MTVRIINADVIDGLSQLEDESVHCVVTSPPYFGLRDYGMPGQIGLEPTPDAYVAKLVEVFREVRRVLRKDGTCWLNLGDSYAGAGYSNHANTGGTQRENGGKQRHLTGTDCKPKDLIGIPWRVAFALQADGWWLRQDIIWSKPNPMPESVTDRCTKAHEYLFLLTKAERYFYDAEAISEAGKNPEDDNRRMRQSWEKRQHRETSISAFYTQADEPRQSDGTRNKRSVWEVTTQPFPEAHFATFPPALIEPCIKAGCPEQVCAKCGAPWVSEILATAPDGRQAIMKGGKSYDADGRPLMGDNMIDHGARGSWNSGGQTLKREKLDASPSCQCGAGRISGTVLDPFGGSGTTGLVADRLKRNAVLIELNASYAEMARRRIHGDCPLFTEVANAPA